MLRKLGKFKKVRRPRSMYYKEILLEDYGIVYALPKSKLGQNEIIIRVKFKPRKWIGGFGWDIDRQAMHCYASREQRHKKMRFGWEHSEWYQRSPLESLHNLRRVR